MNGPMLLKLWKMLWIWKPKLPSLSVDSSIPVKVPRNTTTIIWLIIWLVSIWKNNCTVNVNWLVNWVLSRRWWPTMVLWVNSCSTKICKFLQTIEFRLLQLKLHLRDFSTKKKNSIISVIKIRTFYSCAFFYL